MESYVFDRESIRELDRVAIEEFGVPGIVLMENAARAVATEALEMLGELGSGSPIALVFCGGGNNGGDGYAAARHLSNAGVQVFLVPVGQPRAGTDAQINAAICQRMGLPRLDSSEIGLQRDAGLIIDAILGTGLDRPVRGDALDAITWINECGRPVLSVDLPSGLDCNTGRPLGAAIRATRTVARLHRAGRCRVHGARPRRRYRRPAATRATARIAAHRNPGLTAWSAVYGLAPSGYPQPRLERDGCTRFCSPTATSRRG